MEKEAIGQKESKEMVWEGLEGERGLWFINMDPNIMSQKFQSKTTRMF